MGQELQMKSQKLLNKPVTFFYLTGEANKTQV